MQGIGVNEIYKQTLILANVRQTTIEPIIKAAVLPRALGYTDEYKPRESDMGLSIYHLESVAPSQTQHVPFSERRDKMP